MKITGSITVATAPDRLWELLQKPEFLQDTIPGCKELKRTAEDEYVGVVGAKIGAISSLYSTKFSLQDKNPPDSFRLLLEGQGKGGFFRANTKLSLKPHQAGTMLQYDGEVAVGGTIVRIGQRLVDATAKMLISQGVKSLKKKIEERGEH
jgi:carbon monoxide dehydrogenase subunit G